MFDKCPPETKGSIQIWSLLPPKQSESAEEEEDVSMGGENSAGMVCELVLCIQGGNAMQIRWMPLGVWDEVSVLLFPLAPFLAVTNNTHSLMLARWEKKRRRFLNWESLLLFSWTVASHSIPFHIPNSLSLNNPSQDNLSTVRSLVLIEFNCFLQDSLSLTLLFDGVVHLEKPLLRLTIPDANCTTFDWLSGSRLAVGLDTGRHLFFPILELLLSKDYRPCRCMGRLRFPPPFFRTP